ncbi:MAG TPA: N-acetylmuramic acid 6-phosphate etherase [Flavobacteriaceae bacterium]|nr:N-acetylmuramic acid 6-phosphate etherase [Flavobacteriaceae bacterium]
MGKFKKITETVSKYDDLEEQSIHQLLTDINSEDKTVAFAVEKAIPQIEQLTEKIITKLSNNGRLFYIGAGTSGRMGVLDASECPPTFGVSPDLVVALIAGGDAAIRHAVENAEDDFNQAWIDLQQYNISSQDIVIGIAASGTTPYVVGGVQKCREEGIITGGITCNPGSPLARKAEFPIEVVVGPEFVTGSSRMKAGTAQKMVLNMISTATMVQLGRVKGNKMIDMQLSNAKLVNRGVKLIMEATGLSAEKATAYLKKYGSVRKALNNINV